MKMLDTGEIGLGLGRLIMAVACSQIPDETSRKLAGLRVRAIREVFGMTSTEFAESYNSKLAAHSSRENGHRYPSPESALAIRAQYNIGLDWIYAGDEMDLTRQVREGVVRRYVELLAAEFETTVDDVKAWLAM
jgi:transcriptional regulator with XRE-family HTH domain